MGASSKIGRPRDVTVFTASVDVPSDASLLAHTVVGSSPGLFEDLFHEKHRVPGTRSITQNALSSPTFVGVGAAGPVGNRCLVTKQQKQV
jgi:hypothetical protein